MTIGRWLTLTSNRLDVAGIGTARLDALVLLEDVTNKKRAWLLAHLEELLTVSQIDSLSKMIKKRLQHIPLAYIRGKTEFYGREFSINSEVLEPRPESENMIELLKSLVTNKRTTIIADIGTGSGALAITAKKELPRCTIVAADYNPLCIDVAKDNARNHKIKIQFLTGDLLRPLLELKLLPTVIMANLPYVPNSYQINQAATMEPHSAIFGGSDGLDLYRSLFSQTRLLKIKPRLILTEAMPFEHPELINIAKTAGYTCCHSSDFVQAFIDQSVPLREQQSQ